MQRWLRRGTRGTQKKRRPIEATTVPSTPLFPCLAFVHLIGQASARPALLTYHTVTSCRRDTFVTPFPRFPLSARAACALPLTASL